MPSATGNPGEILVLADSASWASEMGEALRSVYHQSIYAVPQDEHIFDLYPLTRSEFKKELNKKHRNVIKPVISKDISNAQIEIIRDTYSKPQLILRIEAPDIASFEEIVTSHSQELIKVFREADRDRWLHYYKAYQIEKYSEKIKEKHHISLVIPKNYKFDVDKKDFSWLSYETRNTSYGILIYHYSYEDTNTFSRDYLIDKRNAFLKKYVPGEREGSYMTTETKYHIPRLKEVTHNGEYTAILEGLWKVHNDFMGGPFISYTKLNKSTNMVITVEGFVYDPRGENRNKIRKLEAILHTMDVPN